MTEKSRELWTFAWRVSSLHMIVYLIGGLLALYFMDYENLFATGALAALMRPTGLPIVALGPGLQIILGLVLSLILYPYRAVFLSKPRGWLYLVLLLAGFCLFTPQIPGPGNFEGLLYTNIAIAEHLLSLPETLFYCLLFPVLLTLWYRFPHKAWVVISLIAVSLIMVISCLGYLEAIGLIPA